MIILDTNVVSALMRARSDEVLLAWLDDQPRTSVWTTSITVLEVRFGLEIMKAGRRRQALEKAFERLLEVKLQRRVAAFDGAAGHQTASLMGARQRRGEPRELRDSMIAGIALARRSAVATGNTRHFDDAGIVVINPWQSEPA